MTIAREGYPFVLAGVVPGLLLLALYPVHSIGWLLAPGILLLLFGLACAAFFRNPRRDVPAEGGILVSPADGKILGIRKIEDMFVGPAYRIDIFLSVFNVHLNRIPASGQIAFVQYRPGKFWVAFKDKASEENERTDLGILTDSGSIRVAQIAGTIARRIICSSQKGDAVARGQLYGLIRFGSRVEMSFPLSYEPSVAVGDHVRGGETIMARLRTDG